MLQTMRALSKSFAFKILMGLLIVTFAAWGIGDIFRGSPRQRAVAEVGDIKITVEALEREFKNGLPEARRVFGSDLTEQQARQMGVMDRTLNLMIEHAKFDQEAQRLLLDVNLKTILAKLENVMKLRDKNGQFDKVKWQELLRKNGFTEESFLAMDRQDTLRRLVFDSVVNGAKPPQLVVDNLYRAMGSKRLLEVLTVQNASMESSAAPDEATLQEFHQKHSAVFTAPEYRAVTVAKLSPDDITKDIKTGDDDLKKAYDARDAELTLPEQRDIVQVVLQDETKAHAVAASLKDGDDLASAVKTKGYSAVTLNRMDEKTILPELFTTVFALDAGQISDPVKSPLGWHIVQVKAVHPAGKQSFDEAKDKLREELQREQSGDIVARTVNQLDDLLAEGRSLEDIADSLKMRLVRIANLDAQGLTPEGKAPDELPAKDEVLRAAFGQGAGDVSQVIEDKAGNYIVVRTDEVTPSQVRPLAVIGKQVLAAWQAEQKAQKAAVLAEDIAKALRDGKKASAFATRTGVDIRLSKPISMLGDTDPALPPSAMASIMKMKLGDVITAAGPQQNFALRLTEIIPADPAKPDAARLKVVDQLNEDMPYELMEQYSKHLGQTFPVTINKDLLDTMKKQGS